MDRRREESSEVGCLLRAAAFPVSGPFSYSRRGREIAFLGTGVIKDNFPSFYWFWYYIGYPRCAALTETMFFLTFSSPRESRHVPAAGPLPRKNSSIPIRLRDIPHRYFNRGNDIKYPPLQRWTFVNYCPTFFRINEIYSQYKGSPEKEPYLQGLPYSGVILLIYVFLLVNAFTRYLYLHDTHCPFIFICGGALSLQGIPVRTMLRHMWAVREKNRIGGIRTEECPEFGGVSDSSWKPPLVEDILITSTCFPSPWGGRGLQHGRQLKFTSDPGASVRIWNVLEAVRRMEFPYVNIFYSRQSVMESNLKFGGSRELFSALLNPDCMFYSPLQRNANASELTHEFLALLYWISSALPLLCITS